MFESGSTAALIRGILFGSIGVGSFIYGRKQTAVVPLCVGVALCLFPYGIDNVYRLVLVGAVLMAVPYFVRV